MLAFSDQDIVSLSFVSDLTLQVRKETLTEMKDLIFKCAQSKKACLYHKCCSKGTDLKSIMHSEFDLKVLFKADSSFK